MFNKINQSKCSKGFLGIRGLSLIELITTVAIMAILAAILSPSLVQYTEKTRAQRDSSAMSEVVNAVSVSITKREVFNELVNNSIPNNYSCYIDSNLEATYADNKAGSSSYTFDSGARTAIGTPYYPAGNLRGLTITFELNDSSKDSSYLLNNAIVNKFKPDSSKKLSEMPNLYSAMKSVVGNELQQTSKAYRNSEYTIFVSVGDYGTIIGSRTEVYGQYSGISLSEDDANNYVYVPAYRQEKVDEETIITPNNPDNPNNPNNPENPGQTPGGNVGGNQGSHAHKYIGVWTWNGDYSEASVVFTCEAVGCDFRESVDVSRVTIQHSVRKNPTCAEVGKEVYMASVRFEGSTYYSPEEIVDIPIVDVHNYNGGVVTVEPTCGQQGVKTFTCENCNKTYTENISGGHQWGEWTTVSNPTCTDDGEKVRTCDRCSETQRESIDADGHNSKDNECTVCGAKIIPDGAVYTTVDDKIFDGGDEFPEIVQVGDSYMFGDYEYHYGYSWCSDGCWSDDWCGCELECDGWAVRCMNLDVVIADPILENVNGEPVVSVGNAFGYCRLLETSPTIPESVTDMQGVFECCESLTVAPAIPSSVIDLNYAFSGCTSLSTYVGSNDESGNFSEYKLPNGARYLSYMFEQCGLLTHAPVITSNAFMIDYMFADCRLLISAPEIPNGVKFINNAFSGCSALKTAPLIPNSVEYMTGAFFGCTSLTGVITIDTQIDLQVNDGEILSYCFANTVESIYLTGSSNVLVELAATDGYSNLSENDNVRVDPDVCPHPDNVVVVETKSATCTEDGYRAIRCGACGYVYESTVLKAGHNDVDGDGFCDNLNCNEFLGEILYLFNNGSVNEDLTGGWVYVSGSNTTPVSDSVLAAEYWYAPTTYGGYIRPANMIDLTHYKTLKVTRTYADGTMGLNINTDAANAVDWSTATWSTANEIVTLDISDLTGQYYIWLSAASSSGYKVSHVWLE